VWKNIHIYIVTTNFTKTLIWKHEYYVKLWRDKQPIPNTNNHNHHMRLNKIPPWKFSAYANSTNKCFLNQSLRWWYIPTLEVQPYAGGTDDADPYSPKVMGKKQVSSIKCYVQWFINEIIIIAYNTAMNLHTNHFFFHIKLGETHSQLLKF